MKNLYFLLFCFFTVNLYEVRGQTRCFTPNKEQASCIPIKSCKVLYDAVLSDDPEVVRFLRASQCGFSGTPLVCCGSRSSYAPPTTPKPFDRKPHLLATLDECGDSENERILNGQDAGINEFPWAALIRYRNASNFQQFACGGSLISKRYVVTAAHCVVGRILTAVGSPVVVRLGEWNTETERDCYTTKDGITTCAPDKPVDYGIEDITSHSQYIDGSADRYNDIALIRVNRPVQYTGFIKPVCLPQSSDEVRVGQEMIVVGWGRTEKGTFSAIKQKLVVPVVAEAQCRTVFRKAGVNVQSSQLCAGGEEGKDSCSGDSGGPLIAERRNAQYFLEGLVSFGAECGKGGWPGIYTKLSKYRDWIEGNITE